MMNAVLIVLGAAVTLLLVILLLVVLVYIVNPARGRELFALLAAFARSLAKSKQLAKEKPRTHRRRSDQPDAQHVHERSERRTPRPSMMMTIRQFISREDDQ
jgi:hypothetical protein